MRSFRHAPDNKRQVYLAMTGSIESQLRDAYALRHEQGETQASLARKLGIDKASFHRRLIGKTNMTSRTIAEMVWVLGHCISVRIFDPLREPTNQPIVWPEPLPLTEKAVTDSTPTNEDINTLSSFADGADCRFRAAV